MARPQMMEGMGREIGVLLQQEPYASEQLRIYVDLGYEDTDVSIGPASHVVCDPEHLEELLLTGLNSGPTVEATPEYWSDLRRELESRAERRRIASSNA